MRLAGEMTVKSSGFFAAEFPRIVLGSFRHWLKESLGQLDKKELRDWNVCFAKNQTTNQKGVPYEYKT